MKSAEKRTVMLVEPDVVVRLVLAEQLRQCAIVIEAASAQEARAVLVAGPAMDAILADAQLAGGDDTGFALALWVRRYRPNIEVILTASIAAKAQSAADFCARKRSGKIVDVAALTQKIRAMLAERKRRLRPGAPNASPPRRRVLKA